MTLNEPEVIFSSKIDVNSNEKVEGAFWSGVFYKEVELYRKLLNNCPETDSSSTTAKYEQFLHEAIGFYEQLIQRDVFSRFQKLQNICFTISKSTKKP